MSDSSPESRGARILTFLIVAGSSLFFCSKGVMAKLAYRHGADALTVLALRMGFALPFFTIAGIWHARRRVEPLTLRDWGVMAWLGFFGYYLSSLANFRGLELVSVGLERILLYTYPSLVLLGGAVFLRRRVRPAAGLAAVVAWVGIVIAFAGEAGHGGDPGRALKGAGLVFFSAVTYAVFILASGEVLRRIGPGLFTSVVVGFSCLFILTHFALTRPLSGLLRLPGPVYGYGFLLATAGTIIPSYLMGTGLRRAGAGRFAVIGTVGPVATLFLAWAVLGERVNAFQATGFLVSLAGGLSMTLLKDAPVRPGRTAERVPG